VGLQRYQRPSHKLLSWGDLGVLFGKREILHTWVGRQQESHRCSGGLGAGDLLNNEDLKSFPGGGCVPLGGREGRS